MQRAGWSGGCGPSGRPGRCRGTSRASRPVGPSLSASRARSVMARADGPTWAPAGQVHRLAMRSSLSSSRTDAAASLRRSQSAGTSRSACRDTAADRCRRAIGSGCARTRAPSGTPARLASTRSSCSAARRGCRAAALRARCGARRAAAHRERCRPRAVLKAGDRKVSMQCAIASIPVAAVSGAVGPRSVPGRRSRPWARRKARSHRPRGHCRG